MKKILFFLVLPLAAQTPVVINGQPAIQNLTASQICAVSNALSICNPLTLTSGFGVDTSGNAIALTFTSGLGSTSASGAYKLYNYSGGSLSGITTIKGSDTSANNTVIFPYDTVSAALMKVNGAGFACTDSSGSSTSYVCTIPDYPAAPSGQPYFLIFTPGTNSTAAACVTINGGSCIPFYKFTNMVMGANNDLRATVPYLFVLNSAGNGYIWVSHQSATENIPMDHVNWVLSSDQTRLNTFTNECPASTTCSHLMPEHGGIVNSGGFETVTESANTVAFTQASGAIHRVTLNANVTTLTMTNGVATGENMCWVIIENGTGGYTFPTATSSTNVIGIPIINTAANAYTTACWFWDNTTSLWQPYDPTPTLVTAPTVTTKSGTSGTAVCSQSAQGTLKIATCYLNGYAETGSAQTYTYPTAFSSYPFIAVGGATQGTCGTYNATTTASTLTLPANASMSAETCTLTMVGQ